MYDTSGRCAISGLQGLQYIHYNYSIFLGTIILLHLPSVIHYHSLCSHQMPLTLSFSLTFALAKWWTQTVSCCTKHNNYTYHIILFTLQMSDILNRCTFLAEISIIISDWPSVHYYSLLPFTAAQL